MPNLDYEYKHGGVKKTAKLNCGCEANPAPHAAKPVGAACYMEADDM